MTAGETAVARVEELTVRFLDGEAGAAERDELADLIERDAEARRIHLRLVEVEVALRGERPAQVAPAVMEQIAQDRADRAVRGVMRQVSTMTPVARGPRATRRRWPALVLGLLSAAVIALMAMRRPPAPTVAIAPRPARRAVVASPDFSRPAPVETAPGQEDTVLAHDFEAGVLPAGVVDGLLAQIDCARGSQGCLVGTMSEFDRQQNTVTIERFKPPLLTFDPGQVLSFDYKVGNEVRTMRVQLWSRDRHTNFAIFLDQLVRERWVHAQIRLADLRSYGDAGTLLAGDSISNIMITAGRAGESAFFVDNLRVTSHPEDALPATTAAIPVGP
jgi:hypothetical protein